MMEVRNGLKSITCNDSIGPAKMMKLEGTSDLCSLLNNIDADYVALCRYLVSIPSIHIKVAHLKDKILFN